MKRLNVFKSLAVLFVFSLTIWGFLPSVSEGAVPQFINFQGVVKDSAGNTPAVDMLSVTFTIYDAPLGGTALWTETQSITIVAGGLFSVLLGSTSPIPDSVFADTVRWLGIKVETDPEMLPRQQLVSVGYAYRVNSIDGALGGTINGAIDAPGMSSKIRFHYNDVSEFPSASAYHGMFAHSHFQGAAYYAHAAQWVRLADSAHLHSSLAASDLFPNPALSVDAVGNVGIGTTSPSAKLHVEGGTLRISGNGPGTDALHIIGTSDGAAIRIENTNVGGGTKWAHIFVADVGGPSSDYGDAGSLNFRVNSQLPPKMVISQVGNVGIGTTTPTAKLEVLNSVSSVSSQQGVSGITSNSSTGSAFGGIFTASSAGTGIKSGVRGNASSVSANPAYGVYGEADNGSTGDAYGGFFNVPSSGGTGNSYGVYSSVANLNGWGFYTPNNAYMGGNVGIGTASPQQKLHLFSSGTNTGIVVDGGIAGRARLGLLPGGVDNGELGYKNDLQIGTISDASLVMTEKVRITNSGNVGIGTTAPSNPLQMGSGAHVTAGGTWTNASSRSYKTDIQPLKNREYSDILEKLQKVDVVRFKYKKEPGREHIGLIAEDVPEEIASEDRTGVPTADAIAFLMAAVKAQQNKIQELEETIKQLKNDR
ncbi:MAG: tail fiber domain-containing protein, partial [Limisphaerales bacterium]